MSSYLNFYLVPKKNKITYSYDDNGHKEEEVKLTEGKPLLFSSYSRSGDVYQAFNDVLSIAYTGDGDKYTDITVDDVKRVINEYEVEINETKNRLAVNYKMLKEGGYHEELYVDIQSAEKYLKEQEHILNILNIILKIVYECYNVNYNDFEKVVANIN